MLMLSGKGLAARFRYKKLTRYLGGSQAQVEALWQLAKAESEAQRQARRRRTFEQKKEEQ